MNTQIKQTTNKTELNVVGRLCETTNGNAFQKLDNTQKEAFRETYRNHPLADFIDWDAFYESQNGNTLDFVKCIDKYKDENGNTVFFLKQIQEDDMDYKLLFVCGENCFIKEPDDSSSES